MIPRKCKRDPHIPLSFRTFASAMLLLSAKSHRLQSWAPSWTAGHWMAVPSPSALYLWSLRAAELALYPSLRSSHWSFSLIVDLCYFIASHISKAILHITREGAVCKQGAISLSLAKPLGSLHTSYGKENEWRPTWSTQGVSHCHPCNTSGFPTSLLLPSVLYSFKPHCTVQYQMTIKDFFFFFSCSTKLQ